MGLNATKCIIGATQKISFFAVVFFMVAIVSCSSDIKPGSETLASIKHLEITRAHFLSSFKRYYYKTGQSLMPSFENKMGLLNSEFDVYTLAVHAMDLGFDKDEEAERWLAMLKRKALAEEYLQQEVLDGIQVSDDDTRQLFFRLNTTLQASHLYAADSETADSLYALLQSGRAFEELASEVFQSSYLAANGGDVGRFTVDDMDISFEDAAFSLKTGEYSAPVRTSQGFSIVKLTGRFTRPLLTETEYAAKKPELEAFELRRKTERVKRSHVRAFTSMMQVDEVALRDLWSHVQNNPSFFYNTSPEDLGMKPLTNSPIGIFEDFRLSFNEFVLETYHTPVEAKSRIRTFAQFKDYTKAIAFRVYSVQMAIKKGVDKQDNVKNSIDHSFYVYLHDRAVAKLEQEIEVSEQELRDEFGKRMDSYVKPVEMELSRIVLASAEDAHKVKNMLDAGADFIKTLQKFTIKNDDLIIDGSLGVVPLTMFGSMSHQLKDLQPGQTSQPVMYREGEYHIYKCDARIEARPLLYIEAKDMIYETVFKQKMERLRAETIQMVRARHNAFINEEALKNLSIQL